MITEWLLGLAQGLVTWFLSLFPQGPAPAWMTTVGTFLQNLINSGAGLSPWIPWPLVIGVATFQIGFWVVMVSIKVGRWLLGLIPTWGSG